MLAANPQLDPLLEPGDVVFIPQRPSTVTVLGEVMQPGSYTYQRGMKVDDYVHFCQDRNYHDAVAVAGRPGYFECFLATPAAEFPDLAATVGGSDA